METTLIVGCGYVGRHVAERLHRKQRSVLAIVRGDDSAHALASRGYDALRVNLDVPDTFIPPTNPYRILYLIPPPRYGTQDTRIRALLEALSTRPPRRFVYCSSSAVYGDRDGDWVDETAFIDAQSGTASRRLDAERVLQYWSSKHGVEHVILRIAGIYGSERLPLARLRSGRATVRENEAGWSNRIHVDDLADACVAALDHATPRTLYNVADGHPSSTTTFLRAVAESAGLPALPEISLADALALSNAEQARFIRESRRLDVTRMREDLLPELSFPDFTLALRSPDRDV